MLILYLLILLLALLSGWFILWQTPSLYKIKNKDSHLGTFSLIIPARNEEKNLAILLESLQTQSLIPLEIIVVDDESTDKTAEVATKYGAIVVRFPEVQTENWFGKSAACWYGAQKAQGEYLLFLDADTYLPKQDSLSVIIQHYQTLGTSGALSIQPYHTIKKAYENLSVLFNIIVLAGMNRFTPLKDRLQPAGAFGPSLLCRRDTYFELGGHKRVRHSVMENIDLGKVFLNKGLPVHLYPGKNVIHMRMYPDGLASLIEGWTKSFASGSQSTHPLIILGISLWIIGSFTALIFPFYFLASGNTNALNISIIGYLLFFLQIFRMARIAGNFHLIALLLFPILFMGFIGLFIWSFVKTFFIRQVSWKGRNIST